MGWDRQPQRKKAWYTVNGQSWKLFFGFFESIFGQFFFICGGGGTTSQYIRFWGAKYSRHHVNFFSMFFCEYFHSELFCLITPFISWCSFLFPSNAHCSFLLPSYCIWRGGGSPLHGSSSLEKQLQCTAWDIYKIWVLQKMWGFFFGKQSSSKLCLQEETWLFM